MNAPLNILIIEDDDNDYVLLLRALSKEGLSVQATRVDRLESIARHLNEANWDLVISDNNVPDKRVRITDSLALCHRTNPETPFIIVSGTIGEENAVNMMKLGASDYILKDNLARLVPAIKRELADAASRKQRMEAERKLKDSQVRYEILASSIKDMFFALNSDLVCTFWNRAAEFTTGVKASQAVGKSLYEVLPVAKRSDIQSMLNRCIKTHRAEMIEIDVAHRHHTRYYQISFYPSVDVHSVIVKDVTESRAASIRLAAVNDELETFIYRVSHDIRGPLASMKGLLNLAQTNLGMTQEEFVARMDTMATRLEVIVKNFQEVARIKQENPVYEDVDLSQLVNEAVSGLNGGSTDLQISWEDNADNVKLYADPKLLGIAIEKIVANAVDFKYPNRASRLSISCRQSDSTTKLTLTDNGVGIPEEHYEKIFKMFFRGNLQSAGSGLGLYMAANAVERLSGSIEVRSKEGVGSQFTIRLPQPMAAR